MLLVSAIALPAKIPSEEFRLGKAVAEVGVRGAVGHFDGFDERNSDEVVEYAKREALALPRYKGNFGRSYGLAALIRVPRDQAFNQK